MLQSFDTEGRSFSGTMRPDPQPPRAHSLLEELRAVLETDPEAARNTLDELALVLGVRPARVAPPAIEARSFPDILRGGLAPWQLRVVTDFVDRNLSSTMHVETLAGLVRLSTSHFCRSFKVSVGDTPHAYIMRRRLERAQAMMLESAESLSQIAAACGLADQAHLTRLFRRYTGQTPFNWRRAFRTAA